jgi:hypothetical protein
MSGSLWTRFWMAEEMLRQTAPAGIVKPEASPGAQQLVGQQAKRAAPTDRTEQERLFREFLEWSKSSRRQQ